MAIGLIARGGCRHLQFRRQSGLKVLKEVIWRIKHEGGREGETDGLVRVHLTTLSKDQFFDGYINKLTVEVY